jgi:type I restriction enzyme S subunit
MEKVKLEDVCTIKNGFAFKSNEFRMEGVPLIRISSFNDGEVKIDENNVYLDNSYLILKSDFKVEKGDVLIALSGATTGKYGVYNYNFPNLLNQRVGLLKSGASDKLNGKYFYFYLTILKNEILRKAGGAAQPNISTKAIGELKIPLPPLPTQKKIAAILDSADQLRNLNKQLIEKYDALTQSLFLDMFGDPVRNEKGWELKKLGDLGKWQSGGTPSRQKPEYFKGTIPWLSSGELEQKFISDSKEHISELAIQESSAKIIEKGSLLLGMYDTAALKSTISAAYLSCNQSIASSRLNDTIVNTEYVYFIIQIGKEHYRRLQRGVRQKNLNLSMVKEIEILYPPILLQNQFAERVQAIEAQKAQAQVALQKSEDLFNALLQKAFKGELVV